MTPISSPTSPSRRNSRRGKDPVPVKGETPKARGERTRRRVAESLISLIEEGDASPTAKAVAARAGVSVRLVFHHFEDMESLYRMALEVQLDQHFGVVRDVEPDLTLDERIERTVAHRARLFDAIGPVRRSAQAMAAGNAAIADALGGTDGLLREWMAVTYAPELKAAGRGRRDLLDVLDAAASFEAWDRLRRVQGLSVPAARRAVARTLAALLHS